MLGLGKVLDKKRTAAEAAVQRGSSISLLDLAAPSVQEPKCFCGSFRMDVTAQHLADPEGVGAEFLSDRLVLLALHAHQVRSHGIVEVQGRPLDDGRVQFNPGHGVSFSGHGFDPFVMAAAVRALVGSARSAWCRALCAGGAALPAGQASANRLSSTKIVAALKDMTRPILCRLTSYIRNLVPGSTGGAHG